MNEENGFFTYMIVREKTSDLIDYIEEIEDATQRIENIEYAINQLLLLKKEQS
jgi:Mg2+ and Co2+ transporter CorA